MLSAHNNLNDVRSIEEARQLLEVRDLGFQEPTDVDIGGGNLRCHDFLIRGVSPGLCYAVGDNKILTTSDWFNRPQNEVNVSMFSNQMHFRSFVPATTLGRAAFSGELIDLDIYEYSRNNLTISDYLLNKLYDTRYKDKVLLNNFMNLDNAHAARSNLDIAGISELQALSIYDGSLFVNHLSVPHLDANGMVLYDSLEGSFRATSEGLSTASFTQEGLVHFSEMLIPSGEQIRETIYLLSNALQEKMSILDPVVKDMIHKIRSTKGLFFSSSNALRDANSDNVKETLSLGSLHRFDSNYLYMSGTDSTLVVSGTMKSPALELMNSHVRRKNSEMSALYHVLLDSNNRLSNIVYDDLNVAVPIASNHPYMESNQHYEYLHDIENFTYDPHFGRTFVYTKDSILEDPTHIYHEMPNRFAMSYRLFVRDAVNALNYLDNITDSVKMSDYFRENNVRVVTFETFSNQYDLNNLSSSDISFEQESLFTVYTSNYLTSNMLRRNNNLSEIQLLLNNRLSNNLTDFEAGLQRIADKFPPSWIQSQDYNTIRQILILLRNDQNDMFQYRDYSDPSKREEYLLNIYNTLELNDVAWTSDFENLALKPTRVSLFSNDQEYINSFDPFDQFLGKEEAQTTLHRNIGIGTIARQDANAVDISLCDFFDATYVHAMKGLRFDLETGEYDPQFPMLFMAEVSDYAWWVRAPIFNYFDSQRSGLVRFTDNPLATDNNAVVSLSNLQFIKKEIDREFENVFNIIKYEYSRRGRSVFDFIDSSQMYLFEF